MHGSEVILAIGLGFSRFHNFRVKAESRGEEGVTAGLGTVLDSIDSQHWGGPSPVLTCQQTGGRGCFLGNATQTRVNVGRASGNNR
jgi:hypothetical protein